ncbi:MAG: aminopeptidase, partial [Billgrantia desiderata]
MKRRRSPLATVLGVIGCVFVLVLGGGYWLMLHMPGTSFHGDPPPLGAEGELLRERLQRHVRALS